MQSFTLEKIKLAVGEHHNLIKSIPIQLGLAEWDIFALQREALFYKAQEMGLISEIKKSSPKAPINILIIGPGRGEEVAFLLIYLTREGEIPIGSLTVVDTEAKLLSLLTPYTTHLGKRVRLVNQDMAEFLQSPSAGAKYDLIFWGNAHIYRDSIQGKDPFEHVIPTITSLGNKLSERGVVYLSFYYEKDAHFILEHSNGFFEPTIKITEPSDPSQRFTITYVDRVLSPHKYALVSTPSYRNENEHKNEAKPMSPSSLEVSGIQRRHPQATSLPFFPSPQQVVDREAPAPEQKRSCCSQLPCALL